MNNLYQNEIQNQDQKQYVGNNQNGLYGQMPNNIEDAQNQLQNQQQMQNMDQMNMPQLNGGYDEMQN